MINCCESVSSLWECQEWLWKKHVIAVLTTRWHSALRQIPWGFFFFLIPQRTPLYTLSVSVYCVWMWCYKDTPFPNSFWLWIDFMPREVQVCAECVCKNVSYRNVCTERMREMLVFSGFVVFTWPLEKKKTTYTVVYCFSHSD